MTPPSFEAKVQDFLAQKRIAVAGVSRDKSRHPAGACPSMFGDGVDFGHACMRAWMKHTGGLPQ